MIPLWDTQPHRRQPTFTLALIMVNLTVFGYEVALWIRGPGALESFLVAHALVPARFIAGWQQPAEWLTLFTSMFLHGSVAHVLGNCWFLWIFGNSVETKLRPLRFLAVYLVGGLAAAGLQIMVSRSSGIPMVGASGAISAVLGVYLVLFTGAWIVTLVPWIVPIIPVPAFIFLVVWFVLQATSGVGSLLDGRGEEGGVAWWAHIGGFAAGVLLARNLRPRARRRPRKS